MTTYAGLWYLICLIVEPHLWVPSLLKKIFVFTRKEAARNFFPSLLTQADKNACIDNYCRTIIAMAETFSVSLYNRT